MESNPTWEKYYWEGRKEGYNQASNLWKDKIREIIDKYKYAKIPGMKQALEEIEKELLEEWLDE